ncbi:MAG: hypothetical protein WDN48_04560 [Pseudolabrys sp.]
MLLERFPQLTIDAVGHHDDVGPYIADTEVLLCFSPRWRTTWCTTRRN